MQCALLQLPHGGPIFLGKSNRVAFPTFRQGMRTQGYCQLSKKRSSLMAPDLAEILERGSGRSCNTRHLLPSCKGYFAVISFGLRVKVVTTMLE